MNGIVDDTIHSVMRVQKQINNPTPTFKQNYTPKFTPNQTNYDNINTINNSDKIYVNYYNRVN